MSVEPAGRRLTFCTVVSKNYLAHARVLTASLREHNPQARVVVLLCDRIDGRFDPRAEPFEIVCLEDLPIPFLRRFCFQYTILELNTAAKPFFLTRLLEGGAGKVVYHDPYILVTADLEPIADALDRAAVLLTPHLTAPYADSARPAEVDILRAGTYNLGFIALRDSATARRLLEWWSERLATGCLIDLDRGYHVDQKWIDLVPGFFDDVAVVRDPGWNVAYWNLPTRPVVMRNGRPYVGDAPVRFFHFSGYDPRRPEVVSKYQTRLARADLGEAGRLFEEYGRRLRAAGLAEVSQWPYAFGFYSDGAPISDEDRLAFRENRSVLSGRSDPFAVEAARRVRPGPGGAPGPHGVNLIGYLNSEKGVGQAARALVDALDAAGIRRSLVGLGEPGSRNLPDGERPAGPAGYRHAVNVAVVNADAVPYFVAEADAAAFVGRWNVAFWNWELERFPAEWCDRFALFDEIWVPSEFTRGALLAAGCPVPVRCVPYPVRVPLSAEPPLRRSDLGLADDAFVFLFAFDFMSYAGRKNPIGAVRAFRSAFGDRPDVALLLKTAHSAIDPRGAAELAEARGGAANIRVQEAVLSRRRMNSLIALCDAVVSLHRAEGFGFLPAEAMALGKPVIATDYSATAEFLNAANGLPVRRRIVEIDRDHGPYRRGMIWAEPDEAHAAELMRALAADRAASRRLGEAARAEIARRFSPGAVGAVLRERLEELTAHRPRGALAAGPDAAGYALWRALVSAREGIDRLSPDTARSRSGFVRWLRDRLATPDWLRRRLGPAGGGCR